MGKCAVDKFKQKESWGYHFIWENIEFRFKKIKPNIEGYFIMIKYVIHNEAMRILKICAPNYLEAIFTK